MMFGDLPPSECLGAILAHSQTAGGRRLAKGRVLDAADIAAAQAAGIGGLTVARLEAGDVGEADAARQIGDALAGKGLVARKPVHGRVNLVAARAGLLQLDPEAMSALNRIDASIAIGTALPFARVAAGEIVATVKIIPYAVADTALANAVAAAERARLSLAAFEPLTAQLIQTQLPGQSAKTLAKTAESMRARIDAFGGAVVATAECAHSVEALTAALAAPMADLVLIAAASATTDRRDVVPAAIEAAGGRLIRVGMPVDPGNLLVLGTRAGAAVLGLPGCARSLRRNGIDLVLERLFARIEVDGAAIAAMGVGGLLPDLAARPEPRFRMRAAGAIGAILLAAGRSTRMGDVNKLLVSFRGRPLVAHAAGALAAARIPTVAVLGNAAPAVRAALADHVSAFADAPDFAEGLSRSLRAGIRAAPPDWRGALVCLGDMPGVAPTLLRRLCAGLTSEAGIVVPVRNGKRGNPVLWGRAHFVRLATLDGDVGGKVLFGEFADQVVEIEADDDSIFADVDTPADLAALEG